MTGTTVVGTKPPTPRDLLKAELAKFMPSYQSLLPSGYSADRLITGALVAATRNDDLLKCDKLSIAVALATVAQWGLDVGYTAHLVPYGRTCTPVADYKGYIELMCAAGARSVEAHEVREGDAFEYAYGTDAFLRHTPTGKPGAKITGAYGVVTLRGGVVQFEYMTVEEIEEIRQTKSKQWAKGPLPAWYARKTPIRRLSKYVPKTPRLHALVSGDEVDLETSEVTPELLARLEPQRIPGPTPLRAAGYEGEGGVNGQAEPEVIHMNRKPEPRNPFAGQRDYEDEA